MSKTMEEIDDELRRLWNEAPKPAFDLQPTHVAICNPKTSHDIPRDSIPLQSLIVLDYRYPDGKLAIFDYTDWVVMLHRELHGFGPNDYP